ncbi:MAG: hypothetical protein RIS21_921 [Planctomycetota bacterium]
MTRTIYFDANATTRPLPEVVEAVTRALRDAWGNPSSLHGEGAAARECVESARARVAALIGARTTEVIFTSGATESVNTVIRSAVAADRTGRPRILHSAVEHECVIEAAAAARSEGAEIVSIPVDGEGRLDLDVLRSELDRGASLCSVMWSNNETGTLLPVRAVAEACRARGVPLHVDATQAPGKDVVAVEDVGVDFLSISAHKFHGPKGVGALYVRRGARFRKWMHGAPHEGGRRAGTENVPGIVGMGVAAERAASGIAERRAVMASLAEELERGLLAIEGVVVNGRGDGRMPGTVNVSFHGIEGASVVLTAAREGLCLSAGSACSAAQFGGSHVLEAMGMRFERLLGAVRYSLSAENTRDEVGIALDVTRRAVAKLREMDPARRRGN